MSPLKPSSLFNIDEVITSLHDATSTSEEEYAEAFYFEDVYIKVESTIFKLHKRNLESESRVFKDMFSVPQGDIVQGTSNENPIFLDGVKHRDFIQLLRVLFGRQYGQEETLLPAQWLSVLKLADQYNFSKIRQRSISELEPSLRDKPTLMAALAAKYGIDEWLIPALTALARRKEPLDVDDYKALGIDTIIKLGCVREQYIEYCEGCPLPVPATFKRTPPRTSTHNLNVSSPTVSTASKISSVDFAPSPTGPTTTARDLESQKPRLPQNPKREEFDFVPYVKETFNLS